MTRTAGPLCGRLRSNSLKIDRSAIPGHITAAGTLHGQPFLRQPVPSLVKWRARCRWWSSALCFGGLFLFRADADSHSGIRYFSIGIGPESLSPSRRNRYRHPPGIVIAFVPESLSASSGICTIEWEAIDGFLERQPLH